MQVLLVSSHAWHLGNTARAFLERGALGGLWTATKNASSIPAGVYRRCWPYHLAMKPFYHLTSQIWSERATYFNTFFYKSWVRSKLAAVDAGKFDVVQSIMGFATEPFAHADKTGALKVIDCPNSHPTTYRGYWQRECDLFCPGERVPIPQWMFSRMNRELRRADVVLCPSTFVRDTMVMNDVDPERCIVNPFGVNTAVFEPRSGPPAKPRFVCVGTICVRKGYQYLFRAFELVKEQLPDAELVVVGDYKCDFRMERGKWEGSFTHYRVLPHKELSALLRTSTAFVFPSCEEGFARVILEAMACGLPIIATNESGASTLVETGKEGIIVTRNPARIAEAMVRVAQDPALGMALGQAAHAKGGAGNSWQDYGDRLLREYERRLAVKRKQST